MRFSVGVFDLPGFRNAVHGIGIGLHEYGDACRTCMGVARFHSDVWHVVRDDGCDDAAVSDPDDPALSANQPKARITGQNPEFHHIISWGLFAGLGRVLCFGNAYELGPALGWLAEFNDGSGYTCCGGNLIARRRNLSMDDAEIRLPNPLSFPSWIFDGQLARGSVGCYQDGRPSWTLLFGMLLVIDGASLCPRSDELTLD